MLSVDTLVFLLLISRIQESLMESTLMSLMLLHAHSVWEVLFPAGARLGNRQNYSYTVWESSGFKSLSKYFEVTLKKPQKLNSYQYFSP